MSGCCIAAAFPRGSAIIISRRIEDGYTSPNFVCSQIASAVMPTEYRSTASKRKSSSARAVKLDVSVAETQIGSRQHSRRQFLNVVLVIPPQPKHRNHAGLLEPFQRPRSIVCRMENVSGKV